MPTPAPDPAEPGASATAPSGWRRELALALGIVLFTGAVYALSGPGRIDIIDGQFRFDVAQSLLSTGRPAVRDPALPGVEGIDGHRYTGYGPAASIASLPLVWLGRRFGDPYGETARFLFSFTSAVAGGLLAGLVFLFLRRLGVGRRRAVGWTAVHAFATLVWPTATSSFDQVQQATVLFAAVLLAHLSAERRSLGLAAAGGLVAGALLLFQETFLILLPLLGLATLGGGRGGGRARRYVVFLLATGVGLGLWVDYNVSRFDKLFMSGKQALPGHPPLFGDLATGLAGLLASPGKSILLFSPPILLALAGFAGLWRRRRALALTVGSVSLVFLLFTASLTFFGGDWAWGPRYLVVFLPLWTLCFPFVPLRRRFARGLAGALIATGVGVQLLALSVDHQRFFFERHLPPFFWYYEPGYYFDQSQLLARPGEIAAIAARGVPPTAERFQPGPYTGTVTYTMFGSPELWTDPLWLDRFEVFHLPRPWPLWMPCVAERQEVPVPYRSVTALLAALAAAGAAVAAWGLSSRTPTASTESPSQGT